MPSYVFSDIVAHVLDLLLKVKDSNRAFWKIKHDYLANGESTVPFLVIQKRQEQLQYWVDKHETDVEAKQKELDLLKAAKQKDYDRLVDLTRLVSNLHNNGINVLLFMFTIYYICYMLVYQGTTDVNSRMLFSTSQS